jgi:acyl-ACP thioesterase
MHPAHFLFCCPVRYQDTDVHLNATASALVGALQEAAILHSEELGRGIEYLTQRGQGWMITQTRAEVLRPARWRDELRVETWPSEMGRVLSRREFLIRDGAGGSLVRATTLWAFIDRVRQRVCRVPAEVASAYPVDSTRALDGVFGRPAPCARTQWSRVFPIGYRDVDSNRHVNNLRYLEWMIETLPPEVPERHFVRRINIRFQQETRPGAEVTVCGQELDIASMSSGWRRFGLEVRDGSGRVAAAAEMDYAPLP